MVNVGASNCYRFEGREERMDVWSGIDIIMGGLMFLWIVSVWKVQDLNLDGGGKKKKKKCALCFWLESLNCSALKWILSGGKLYPLMETPAFFLISVCLRKTHYFFRSLQRLGSHTDQNLLMSYHCFFTTTCLECCILRRLLKKHKTPIALYLPLFPVCE